METRLSNPEEKTGDSSESDPNGDPAKVIGSVRSRRWSGEEVVWIPGEPRREFWGGVSDTGIPPKMLGVKPETTSEEDTEMPNGSELSREEFEARLSETEKELELKKTKVESMASEVRSSLDSIETKIDERLNTAEAIEDKIDSNTTWAFRMSAITLTIVSLILGALGVVLTLLFQMANFGGS